MDYIVLDLEWNQSARGKRFSVEKMPFEIIQIGAVKLDSQFNKISEFNKIIKPQVYLQMHDKCGEVTGITMDMLKNGGHFVDIASDFLDWCGKDYIFCTWGSLDLIELQRNYNYYEMKTDFPTPFLFYDVQKLYSICFSDGKDRLSLQMAASQLGLEETEKYHMALSDARYTAKILARLDFDKCKKFYSIDTYRIPKTRKQEVNMIFGNYSKFISKGFETREKLVTDRKVRACTCFLCGKPMKRKVKWFSSGSKNYYGVFECEEHGLIKGRFKTKITDDGLFYAVKIMKLTDEAGEEKIKMRQQKEKEHRRLKRISKNEPAR